MQKTQILAVDDEVNILKFLRANLESYGYRVSTAVDGVDAIAKVEAEQPDLVILDIMMPRMDGFEFCRRIREWSNIPIIIVTAKGDQQDIIKGFSLGADDYLVKPFSLAELEARVKAVLRRAGATDDEKTRPAFSRGDFEVNFARRQVTASGNVLNFTPTEYRLIQELVLNAGKVLTYDYLLNRVWGNDYRDEREYLHVFISRLRNKLEKAESNPEYIITVPGVGYRFADSVP